MFADDTEEDYHTGMLASPIKAWYPQDTGTQMVIYYCSLYCYFLCKVYKVTQKHLKQTMP